MCLSEPSWIDDDVWKGYSDDERSPYEAVPNLTYNSVSGNQVVLDPNGPSEDNPSGWKFGGPNTGDVYLGTAVAGAAGRGLVIGLGTSAADGPLPFGEIAGVVIIGGAVIYTIATHEGAQSLPTVDPNIYAKGGNQNKRNHWNDRAAEVSSTVEGQLAWLAAQRKDPSTTKAEKEAIKTAEKALGGRNSNKSSSGKKTKGSNKKKNE